MEYNELTVEPVDACVVDIEDPVAVPNVVTRDDDKVPLYVTPAEINEDPDTDIELETVIGENTVLKLTGELE